MKGQASYCKVALSMMSWALCTKNRNTSCLYYGCFARSLDCSDYHTDAFLLAFLQLQFKKSTYTDRINPPSPVTPRYLDAHRHVKGIAADAVAEAHKKDLQVQGKYSVNYLKYWVDEKSDDVFCLVDAPNPEAAARVHKEAHGLVADEIHEVKEG